MTSISPASISRLRREFALIQKSPPQFITALPLETNILEWHYVIRGPPSTPFAGGIYWGKMVFPASYPFKPPEIRMLTPSGRFMPNVRICMSNTNFHAENWNPSWNVSTILMGLVSFMCENNATYGSVQTTDADKVAYAKKSWKWNCSQQKFCNLFPSIVEEYENNSEPAPSCSLLFSYSSMMEEKSQNENSSSPAAVVNHNAAEPGRQPFLRRKIDTLRNNHDRPEALLICVALVCICVLISYWMP